MRICGVQDMVWAKRSGKHLVLVGERRSGAAPVLARWAGVIGCQDKEAFCEWLAILTGVLVQGPENTTLRPASRARRLHASSRLAGLSRAEVPMGGERAAPLGPGEVACMAWTGARGCCAEHCHGEQVGMPTHESGRRMPSRKTRACPASPEKYHDIRRGRASSTSAGTWRGFFSHKSSGRRLFWLSVYGVANPPPPPCRCHLSAAYKYPSAVSWKPVLGILEEL